MNIVAPAGNPEKLSYAFAYGADACYLAWQNYGLRAAADNFGWEELKQAVSLAHRQQKQVFLTLNVFGKNQDINELPEFLKELSALPLDGVIVSEPGMFTVVKHHTHFPIHISTQANTTNWQAVKFWHDLGAMRIILAREVAYHEMLEIRSRVPEAELEVFIHGAMCMAWSGRCLMSALLNDRSGNQGLCTHPCRWEWNLTEPTRPGEEFSLLEDDRGSYLMYSKDLCLLREIKLLQAAGIAAGKIEGRMKSTYYTALMSRTYKEALYTGILDDSIWEVLANEVNKVNHRPYFTGFLYSGDECHYERDLPQLSINQSVGDWQYCGKVTHSSDGLVWFDCLSKIESGDSIQIIFPQRCDDIDIDVSLIYDVEHNAVQKTKPNQSFGLPVDKPVPEYGLVRKLLHQKS